MTKNTKQKKLPFGGTAIATPFRSGGGVSIAGSVAGGYGAARSEELAQVHAQMLLEGTARRTKKDIQLALDGWGATLSFAASAERLRFAARVPAKHADALLALVAEILREPTFPREELVILKMREQAALAMEAQDTREQARIALARLIYPKGHPGWSESTKESGKILAGITHKHLQGFHAAAHGGASLIISFAGDLAPARAFALAERHFRTLAKTRTTRTTNDPRPVRPKAVKKAAVPIAHKASIDYMVGLPTGITNTHRDYLALLLGLQALGNPGGFTGRLMKTVREEEGLTYGVYAYPQNVTYRVDGLVYAWGTFAPQLFAKGRAAMRREIKRIAEEGAGDAELRRHAALFAARTKVGFSNASSIARITHDTVADRKPLSYIEELPRRIQKLTAKEVNKVLKKYLVLAKMSESAAGPVKKADF